MDRSRSALRGIVSHEAQSRSSSKLLASKLGISLGGDDITENVVSDVTDHQTAVPPTDTQQDDTIRGTVPPDPPAPLHSLEASEPPVSSTGVDESPALHVEGKREKKNMMWYMERTDGNPVMILYYIFAYCQCYD